MSWKIVWSPSARQEYADILKYVEQNFGIDAALKVLDKTDIALDGIVEFPTMFPASQKRKDIRKAVITKQTSLYYRIHSEEIHLLHFWNNRRHPDDIDHLF